MRLHSTFWCQVVVAFALKSRILYAVSDTNLAGKLRSTLESRLELLDCSSSDLHLLNSMVEIRQLLKDALSKEASSIPQTPAEAMQRRLQIPYQQWWQCDDSGDGPCENYEARIEMDGSMFCAPVPNSTAILTINLQNSIPMSVNLHIVFPSPDNGEMREAMCLSVSTHVTDSLACPSVDWIGETEYLAGNVCPPSKWLFSFVLVLVDPQENYFSLLPATCLSIIDEAEGKLFSPVGPCGEQDVDMISLSMYQVIKHGRPFYSTFGFVPRELTTLGFDYDGDDEEPVRFIDDTRLQRYCKMLKIFRTLGEMPILEDVSELSAAENSSVKAFADLGDDVCSASDMNYVVAEFAKALEKANTLSGASSPLATARTVREMFDAMRSKHFRCDTVAEWNAFSVASGNIKNAYKKIFATTGNDDWARWLGTFVVDLQPYGDGGSGESSLAITHETCARALGEGPYDWNPVEKKPLQKIPGRGKKPPAVVVPATMDLSFFLSFCLLLSFHFQC